MAETREHTVKRTAVYARLSTDRGSNAASVEEQLTECEREAARRGWEVGTTYIDRNKSASKPGTKRLAYIDLIADIKRGTVTKLLVYMTDRLYRQPRELEDLIDLVEGRAVTIGTVRSGELDLSTPEGRAYARNAATWNKLESEKISERVRRTKAARRANGVLNGGGRRPYGYNRIPGGLTINEPEAAVIREMADRVLTGESLNRIVIDLNARGIRSAGGGRWRPTWIKRILCGSPNKEKRETPLVAGGANWPAILTADELALVCVKLSRPSKYAPKKVDEAEPVRGREARRYALTGLIFCSECGTKMRGTGSYYRCSVRDGGCGRVSVSARQLEDALDLRIQREREAGHDRDPEPVRPIGGDPEERTALLAELAEYETTVERLADDLASPTTETARRVVNRSIEKLEAKRAATEKRLAALVPEAPRRTYVDMYADMVNGVIDDWHERWVAGELTPVELADLHEMFATYFEAVQIAPSGPRKGRARDAGLDLKRIKVRWAR